ncbi:Rpn family recombination-promoting nuclease/putative transposase [Nodularia spumigena CS-1038]|uniref:Rpn family recombination-promoting nuclease/putative transposase n=1 Tax=Cyanophyceae TaxID=3028117 RepID=UPI00232B1F65|nr:MULTISPECIES: Rpn family recombination-promoting nuclease/putative transposase [Cyanophyceae]MDB9337887.1 Rpn family recombination-promoting nuclease/putative transposase [Nodularia spumigena CS-589/07]MDB9400187.1 Rpn family recombination-promoting nuclease/putative transposase [Microcystis aeruginosa CS-567/02-A1]MDB9532504.1 Rpn family recombination-promoting nuclease/putative transposase [Nodularia spumigena CS-1038]
MTEITANYDETWKEVIGDYFDSFLAFFYPEIYQQIDWTKNPISLDKELEQITASADSKTRHADKLFQVWLLDNQEVWILIHVEVQSQYDKEFSQRMFIYNYRAFDLYQKPVISLAILGDETNSWRPSSYQYVLGSSQLIFNFSSVKLLDYQWEELEQSNNIFAIVVMAHLKTKATNSNLSAREQWKWNLARLLYERGYNRKEIVDLYKVIDLMMALSQDLQLTFEKKLANYQEERKMPLLTNIEQRTIKQTRKQDIIKLVQVRFGNMPENLVGSINQIDNTSFLEQLLVSTISVNSLEEFAQLVNSHLPEVD